MGAYITSPEEIALRKTETTEETITRLQAKPNLALTVERPLYDLGPNHDFIAYRKRLLSKGKEEQLPTLQFMDGLDVNGG